MKISCIIPAFNEASRIGAVLDVVTQCKDISEIIVIDDCSSDGTLDVIMSYKEITVIQHPVNKGKSTSIYDGIQKSTGELLVFIDADLIGLSQKNIEELISPVLQREAAITLSLRGNTPWLWKYLGIDYISGERCFHRNMITDSLEELKKLTGFGLEVFLNKIIIKNKLRIRIVTWPNVISPFKRKKFGINFDFLVIGFNICREISPFEAMLQIITMRRAKI